MPCKAGLGHKTLEICDKKAILSILSEFHIGNLTINSSRLLRVFTIYCLDCLAHDDYGKHCYTVYLKVAKRVILKVLITRKTVYSYER